MKNITKIAVAGVTLVGFVLGEALSAESSIICERMTPTPTPKYEVRSTTECNLQTFSQIN
ncbi:MAG: hypothetical protein C0476_01085 [Sphingomonas sp.]|nr:hypothetical protein [Sphingomonas sp.]